MLRRIHAVVAGLMYAGQPATSCCTTTCATALRFLYFADQRDTYVAEPERDIPDRGDAQQRDRRAAAPRRAAAGTVGRRPPAPRRGARQPPRSRQRGLAGRADAPRRPRLRRDRGAELRPPRRLRRGRTRAAGLRRPAHPHRAGPLPRARGAGTPRRGAHPRAAAAATATCRPRSSSASAPSACSARCSASPSCRSLPRTLERFYAQVHDVVGELLYARNFYIALLSDDGETLEFPYSIDERDAAARSRASSPTGLTEYVIAQRSPAAGRPQAHCRAEQRRGKVRSRGSHGALLARRAAVPRRSGGRRDRGAELFARRSASARATRNC